MSTIQDDKRHHRIVTARSLAAGLLIYCAARFGFLGDSVARFSTAYLVIMLVVLGVRAILTEMGMRRRRFSFKRRLLK